MKSYKFEEPYSIHIYFWLDSASIQLFRTLFSPFSQAQEPEIFLLDKLIQDGIDIKESTTPSSAGSSKFDCKYISG